MQLLSDCSFCRKTRANHVPHYTLLVLPLLVRDCLFVRIYLLISQLTSISRGRSTIRHLWTRVIAVSSATQVSSAPHCQLNCRPINFENYQRKISITFSSISPETR